MNDTKTKGERIREEAVSHGDRLREAAVARARGLHEAAVGHAAEHAPQGSAAPVAPTTAAQPTPATPVVAIPATMVPAGATQHEGPPPTRIETATADDEPTR